MKFGRFAAGASLLPLGLLLAACGGGGVNSTPTPTPGTPTPTPTPGTPTPTPTPTPSVGANDDLLAPLVSESFTNVAARAKATITVPGTSNGTASAITATISYNSSNQSYTLTTPTGTITFGPGDIDESQSSAGAVVYLKTSGSQTDSLTLTRPGTSGPLTYKYVGGAFWQRLTQNSANSVTGSIDSIVYGVETQPGDVPVSGKANYDIDLIGARTTTNDLTGLAGQGTASVDFTSGKIVILGDLTLGSVFSNGAFYGSAALSSGGAFSGTLTIEDGEVLKGQLDGRFFGPGAAEIGAAFRATGPVGMVATGAILGRKGGADTPDARFGLSGQELAHSATFAALQSRVDFNASVGPGWASQTGQFSNVSAGNDQIQIRYDHETDDYLILDGTHTFHINGMVAGLDGTDSASWRTWDTDTDYLRVGFLQYYLSAGAADYRYAYQLYGMPTPNGSIVRTGGAAYRVHVGGLAVDNAYSNPMAFDGDGELTVALQTGEVSGNSSLNYSMIRNDSTIPPQSANGNWSFNGTLSSSANLFTGTVSLDGIGTYSGQGSGQLFGPNMEEVGGVFSASKSGGALSGAFYGARDPSSGTSGGLAGLTSQTVLHTIANAGGHQEGEIVSIAYEPNFGGYYVQFKYVQDPGAPVRIYLMDPSLRDGGDASADIYNRAIPDAYQISGLPASAMVERIGNANPAIQLHYMTFGDMYLKRSDTDVSENDYHVFATGLRSVQPPTTGSATYSGLAMGFARVEANGSGAHQEVYRLDGDTALSVNFGSHSLNGTFSNLSGALLLEDVAGQAPSSRSFSDIAVSATISGDSFSGSQTASGWTKAISGGFFGPQAQEAGGIFSADFGTSGVSPEVIDIDGAFGAVKN